MISMILTKMFGSKNDRVLKKITPIVEQINQKESVVAKMTDEELDDYIASGEWAGKAGAYAIQENADKFVTKTDGSFTNIIGLPMEMLQEMLAQFDIQAGNK